MRNLHLTFDYSTYSQKLCEDFAKFCGLLRIYELYSSNISFSSSGYPSLIEAYIEDNLPYDVNTYAFLTWDHWKVAGSANLPRYRVEDGWKDDGRPHRDQGKNYKERSLGKAPFNPIPAY